MTSAVACGRRLSGEPVRGCPALSWSCVEPSDDEVVTEFGAVADVALALSGSAGLLDLPKTRHRLYLVELLGNVYLHPGREHSRG